MSNRTDELPGTAVGSPSGVDSGEGEEMWYRPDWMETARLVGWRWISVLPIIGVGVAVIMEPAVAMRFMIVGWKVVAFLVALPMVMVGKAWKSALAGRKEPFCIHCGYGLTGLPDGHNCPECGRRFSLAVAEEYRRDPTWFIERYRMHKSAPVTVVPFEAGPVRRKKSRDGT